MVAKTIGDSMGALEFSFWRWAVAVLFIAPFAMPRVLMRMGEIRSKLRKVFLLGTFMAGGSTCLIWSVQMTTAFNDMSFNIHNSGLVCKIVYMAIFPTIIATTMWNVGIKALGPNKASAFINLMPVLGILVSVKFFKDPVQIHHILGMILTCTGVIFVLTGGKQDKSVSPYRK